MSEHLLLLPAGLPRVLALMVAAGILSMIWARRRWVEALREAAQRVDVPLGDGPREVPGEAGVARSLVVVAHNEACRLPALLQDLERLLEQDGGLEILLADDASSDATRELLADFCTAQGIQRARLLPADPTRRGKPAWLRHAVEQCCGEVVLFTDADCRLPLGWSLALAGLLEPEAAEQGCVAAGGVVLLEPCPEPDLAQRWQRLHWILLSACGAAICALRGGRSAPSLWGANLAFRRSRVEELGGYASLAKVHEAEDLAFVQALRKRGAHTRLVATPRQSRVRTAPESWSGAARQLGRWALGVRHLGLAEVALLAGIFGWLLALMGILLIKPALGLLLLAVSLMPLSALLDELAASLDEAPAGLGGAALYLTGLPPLVLLALYHSLRGDSHWRRPR